jgi:hypothetical protein
MGDLFYWFHKHRNDEDILKKGLTLLQSMNDGAKVFLVLCCLS